MPSPGEWRFFKRAQCIMPDSMDVITVLPTGWSASTAKTCSTPPFSGSIWQRCEEKSISSCRHGRFGWSGWLVVPSFRPVGLPTEPNVSAALSRSSHHLRCATSSDGFSLPPAPQTQANRHCQGVAPWAASKRRSSVKRGQVKVVRIDVLVDAFDIAKAAGDGAQAREAKLFVQM